jgi:hypothetical protein
VATHISSSLSSFFRADLPTSENYPLLLTGPADDRPPSAVQTKGRGERAAIISAPSRSTDAQPTGARAAAPSVHCIHSRVPPTVAIAATQLHTFLPAWWWAHHTVSLDLAIGVLSCVVWVTRRNPVDDAVARAGSRGARAILSADIARAPGDRAGGAIARGFGCSLP